MVDIDTQSADNRPAQRTTIDSRHTTVTTAILVSSLNNQIRDCVDSFVRELEGLVRQAAIDSVAQALGGSSAARSSAPAARSPGRPAGRPAAAPKAASGGRKRRTAKEIDSLAQTILEFIEKNPGRRAENIKAALRIPASDWPLPVKKLLDEGRLSTKGEKRATEYFVKKR
ncbi:MAG TPA: hypothetical protein VL400_08705 [Polyangiaceae bacterium]|nr:hypothetical protein [Polyangiaceae bacterium]